MLSNDNRTKNALQSQMIARNYSKASYSTHIFIHRHPTVRRTTWQNPNVRICIFGKIQNAAARSQCEVRWIGAWRTTHDAATADTTGDVSSARPACCHCQRHLVLDSTFARPMLQRCQSPAHGIARSCYDWCCYSVNTHTTRYISLYGIAVDS